MPQTFNEKELRALWESAEHYLENWNNCDDIKNVDIFGNSCACCILNNDVLTFFPETPKISNSPNVVECRACPIARFSGEDGCANTPWIEVHRTYTDIKKLKALSNLDHESMMQLLRDAIEKEYEFLVTLSLEKDPDYVAPF